ncbi:hypothetical protein PR048_028111 [Dryococelus australis]|uniref:Uncharacterized protein n=1 Tax=Dryococelus australis TaxID=614101 RepID=A0ABQ9GID0_9NEOP|nr:hypothetical protein PR048_028111 [Dryococelus australis]
MYTRDTADRGLSKVSTTSEIECTILLAPTIMPRSNSDNSRRLAMSMCRGGVVVRLFVSHLGEPDTIPGGFDSRTSNVRIGLDDAAGRRVFSGFSHCPAPSMSPLLHTHIGRLILHFTTSSGAPRCLSWGPAAGVFLLLESTGLFFLSPDVERQGVAQVEKENGVDCFLLIRGRHRTGTAAQFNTAHHNRLRGLVLRCIRKRSRQDESRSLLLACEFRSTAPCYRPTLLDYICTVFLGVSVLKAVHDQRHDGNTARLARRGDEALGVRVSVARIAPSLLDLGRGVHYGPKDEKMPNELHSPERKWSPATRPCLAAELVHHRPRSMTWRIILLDPRQGKVASPTPLREFTFDQPHRRKASHEGAQALVISLDVTWQSPSCGGQVTCSDKGRWPSKEVIAAPADFSQPIVTKHPRTSRRNLLRGNVNQCSEKRVHGWVQPPCWVGRVRTRESLQDRRKGRRDYDAGAMQRDSARGPQVTSEVNETRKLVEKTRDEVALQCTALEERIDKVGRRIITVEAREQEEVLRTVENKLQELEQFCRHFDDKISIEVDRQAQNVNEARNSTPSSRALPQLLQELSVPPIENVFLHIILHERITQRQLCCTNPPNNGGSHIRSQLSQEHWDPRKEKSIEEHFSEVYERTRHLSSPMSDEEFTDLLISQLPSKDAEQYSLTVNFTCGVTPGFSHVGIMPGRCSMPTVFFGDLRFPLFRVIASQGASPYPTHPSLIGSKDLSLDDKSISIFTSKNDTIVVSLIRINLSFIVRFPAGSLPYFRMWESCPTMPLVGRFSRGSPVSPTIAFRSYPYTPRPTLIDSPRPHDAGCPQLYVPTCTTSCIKRRRTDPRAELHAALCAPCRSDGLPLSPAQASQQLQVILRLHGCLCTGARRMSRHHRSPSCQATCGALRYIRLRTPGVFVFRVRVAKCLAKERQQVTILDFTEGRRDLLKGNFSGSLTYSVMNQHPGATRTTAGPGRTNSTGEGDDTQNFFHPVQF